MYSSRFQDEEFKMATHTATHIDAPCHFGKQPKHPCVSGIPILSLVNLASVVIDVTSKVEKNRKYQVTVQDIKDFENVHGKIPDGSLVIIQTGMGKYWPNKMEYLGTDTKDSKKLKYPSIHQNTARWLVKHRVITGVAIEFFSPDNVAVTGGSNPVHGILLKRNIYIIENVAYNVKDMPRTGCRVTALPMKIENASGAPVRLVANCPDVEIAELEVEVEGKQN
ncbi:Uncharacterized protein HDE_00124 [Halotydeus destructor]|nr:Uncharacterized protein HDE_00124 [Halotydeus destructor]